MKKFGKIFKWTLLVSFALIIIVGVSLWLFFPVEKAKKYAIEKGKELLEREIEITTASVSFWGGIGIQLDNIVIKNQPNFSNNNILTAKSLDVKLQFFPLLSGDIAIDRLILTDPQIHLHKKQNGKNNFTFAKLEKQAPPEIVKQASPETKAAAAIVTFENIEIYNGNLFYQDDSSKSNIVLSGLDLQTTLTHPYEMEYHSNGELSIAKLVVNNELKLPVINASLKYQVKFNQAENSITISKTNLSINEIETTISGTVENIYSDLTAKINIKTEHTDIQNILNFVPAEKKSIVAPYKFNGYLGLDFDLEFQPDTFLYYGIAVLQNVSVEHSEIKGKFLCKEAMLDVKNENIRFNITKGEFDGRPLKGLLTIDGLENPFINGAFAGSLNLKYLEPFLPTKDNHSIDGIVGFDIKISGFAHDIANLKFHGDLQADNVSYNSNFMLEPIDSLALQINFDNEIISIKKFSAQTNSGTFSLGGRVTSLLQYFLADTLSNSNINPTIDAKLKGNLNLSVLSKLLPPKGNPELQGELTIDMQLSGAVNNLSLFRPFGKVQILRGSYSDELLPEKIKSFEAQLTVTPDTITVHSLESQFETSDAQFQGKLINPFPYLLPIKDMDRSKIKKPLFVFTLSSHRFDADKLFPEAVPGVADKNRVLSLDSVSTIIFPDIDGRGTFSVDTLIYSKVQLTSLTGKVNIENKKIECYEVNGFAYEGKLEGNTTIDLTNLNDPQYVGNFNAIQIEVNDFANRFSKLQNIVSGKVDMKGSYNAHGWEPEQFLNSLTMNSTSNIREGKIVLSDDILLKTNKHIKKFIPNLQKEQIIRNLFTNIIIENGNVTFDKLTSKLGNIANIEFGGYYSFTNEIKYDGKIKLSKELSQKLSNNIIDNIILPISLSGTVDNPKFDLDFSSVLKGTAKSFLKDLLK